LTSVVIYERLQPALGYSVGLVIDDTVVTGLCLLAGVVSSIFSVISGILVRVKHGQSCPWPVLSGIALLLAVLSVIILVSAIVNGWL
jgi:hypothetical protein